MKKPIPMELPNQQACLEIDGSKLEETQRTFDMEKQQWEAFFLHELKFASIRVRAFQSGSVATRTDRRKQTSLAGGTSQG